jgi:hypothetical protein
MKFSRDRVFERCIFPKKTIEKALNFIDFIRWKRAADFLKIGNMLELEEVNDAPLRSAIDVDSVDPSIIATVGYRHSNLVVVDL